jgi:hypothetical protein
VAKASARTILERGTKGTVCLSRRLKEPTVCYWLRDLDKQREPASQQQETLPPSRVFSPRPRWAAAIAAAVVALIVVAALIFPSATPAVSTTKAAAPVSPVVEQTSTTLDDGVPSSTHAARSSGERTHCNHDM